MYTDRVEKAALESLRRECDEHERTISSSNLPAFVAVRALEALDDWEAECRTRIEAEAEDRFAGGL